MKYYIVWFMKAFISLLLAFAILSVFCLLYYNPPTTKSQPDLITNYRFKPTCFWSSMTEGWGYGITDELGYNNAYTSNCINPDIVFIGSSHLEALQVPATQNMVCLLNQKFMEDSIEGNDFSCLNLGISGHNFKILVSNFQAVAERYQNAKYIVLEANHLQPFSDEEVLGMLQHKYQDPYDGGSFLSKSVQYIPYARLLLKQWSLAKAAHRNNEQENEQAANKLNVVSETNREYLRDVLTMLSSYVSNNQTKIIILHHSRFELSSGSKVIREHDADYINVFQAECEQSGIYFIDVTDFLIQHYQETKQFSYGFSNTIPGQGHLNRVGHDLVSQVIYTKINELEGLEYAIQ